MLQHKVENFVGDCEPTLNTGWNGYPAWNSNKRQKLVKRITTTEYDEAGKIVKTVVTEEYDETVDYSPSYPYTPPITPNIPNYPTSVTIN